MLKMQIEFNMLLNSFSDQKEAMTVVTQSLNFEKNKKVTRGNQNSIHHLQF